MRDAFESEGEAVIESMGGALKGLRLTDIELHDGHTEHERRIHELLLQADVDGDGVISSRELLRIMCNLDETKSRLAETKAEGRKQSFYLGAVLVALLLSLLSVFGVSLAAEIALKETTLTNGTLTSLTGRPVGVAGVVEAVPLFDVPALPRAALRRLSGVSLHVSDGEGAWNEASFKVAGVVRAVGLGVT